MNNEIRDLKDDELSAVAGGRIYRCLDGKDMLVVNVQLGGGYLLIVSATSDTHHAGVYHT